MNTEIITYRAPDWKELGKSPTMQRKILLARSLLKQQREFNSYEKMPGKVAPSQDKKIPATFHATAVESL